MFAGLSSWSSSVISVGIVFDAMISHCTAVVVETCFSLLFCFLGTNCYFYSVTDDLLSLSLYCFICFSSSSFCKVSCWTRLRRLSSSALTDFKKASSSSSGTLASLDYVVSSFTLRLLFLSKYLIRRGLGVDFRMRLTTALRATTRF